MRGNNFEQNIQILKKYIDIHKKGYQEYINKNIIGNKVEQMLLNNAKEKGKLAIDECNFYEIIGKEKLLLGKIEEFALNWDI